MKPRTIKGQLVASSNPIRDMLTRRFNIEARYTSTYKLKSLIYKDRN